MTIPMLMHGISFDQMISYNLEIGISFDRKMISFNLSGLNDADAVEGTVGVM